MTLLIKWVAYLNNLICVADSKELHSRTESDTDSDTSAIGEMELASSHSSDNEDPEYSTGWKGSKGNGTC